MPSQKKRKATPRTKKTPQKSVRSPRKSLSLILIIIGIVFLVIPALFRLNETIQLSYFTPQVIAGAKNSLPQPTHIAILQVHISLPVKPTAISGNTWGVAQDAISYLAISARPTQKGAIILYSHNTDDRFGPIRWLSNGDQIAVTTSDNKTYTYVVKDTLEVSPEEVSVFNQKDETLILYTCTGFADTKRFVVIAKPLVETGFSSF